MDPGFLKGGSTRCPEACSLRKIWKSFGAFSWYFEDDWHSKEAVRTPETPPLNVSSSLPRRGEMRIRNLSSTWEASIAQTLVHNTQTASEDKMDGTENTVHISTTGGATKCDNSKWCLNPVVIFGFHRLLLHSKIGGTLFVLLWRDKNVFYQACVAQWWEK